MHDQKQPDDTGIPPLPDRLRAAITTLGENYSKSGAQVALGLLREVLPLVEGKDAVDAPELRLPDLAEESGVAEHHWRWKTTIRTAFGQDAGFGPYRAAASDFLFKVIAVVMPLRVHVRLVRRGVEVYSTIEPKSEQVQALEELAAGYARAAGPLYTPPNNGPVEVGGRVTVEKVRFNQGVKPDLLTRLAAAGLALEQEHKASDQRHPDLDLIGTTVEVIRELIDGADDQIEVVNSKFKDVYWLGDGLTGFRFEHLPDVILPDDQAQAMLHQYMVKSAPSPDELFSIDRTPEVGTLPAIAPPGRLFIAFAPPLDRMGQRVPVHVYYLADGKLWVVDRGYLDLHALLVMKNDLRLEVHLQHPAEPSAVSWPSSGPLATPGLPRTIFEVRVSGRANRSKLGADLAAGDQLDDLGVTDLTDDGDATAEQIAARNAANLNDHEGFLRATTPPDTRGKLAAAYVAQGWQLHEDANGITHLLDAEVGTTAGDHGAVLKGRAVEPAEVLDENLCGRCCAAANDRAAQAAADAAG